MWILLISISNSKNNIRSSISKNGRQKNSPIVTGYLIPKYLINKLYFLIQLFKKIELLDLF